MSLVAFALPITTLNGGSPSKSPVLPAACIFSKITLPDLFVTLTQVCSEKDMLTFFVATEGAALLASLSVAIATGLLTAAEVASIETFGLASSVPTTASLASGVRSAAGRAISGSEIVTGALAGAALSVATATAFFASFGM